VCVCVCVCVWNGHYILLYETSTVPDFVCSAVRSICCTKYPARVLRPK